jgi:hypothetical protein
MMEKLQRGSFRGVAFTVISHRTSAGRRLAEHRFAQRDLGYQEDLGRQDRVFTLEAYLVGDDVADQRDRLLQALETPGPGELIHPWYGRLWAVARPTDIAESRQERRRVTVTLTFVEAQEGGGEGVLIAPQQGDRLRGALDRLQGAGQGQFAAVQMAGMPSFVQDRVLGQLGRSADGLDLLRGRLPLTGDERFAAVQSVGAFRGAGLSPDSGGLLAQALDGMLGGSFGADPMRGRLTGDPRMPPQQGVSLLSGLAGALTERPQPLGSTRWRGQATRNDQSLLGGLGMMLLAGGGRSLVPGLLGGSASREEAEASCRPLLDWSERERQAAAERGDDAGWQATGDFQQTLLTAVRTQLPGLQRAGFSQPMPSLAASHRLYGDSGRAAALAHSFQDPRTLAHPGLLTGSGPVPLPSVSGG